MEEQYQNDINLEIEKEINNLKTQINDIKDVKTKIEEEQLKTQFEFDENIPTELPEISYEEQPENIINYDIIDELESKLEKDDLVSDIEEIEEINLIEESEQEEEFESVSDKEVTLNENIDRDFADEEIISGFNDDLEEEFETTEKKEFVETYFDENISLEEELIEEELFEELNTPSLGENNLEENLTDEIKENEDIILEAQELREEQPIIQEENLELEEPIHEKIVEKTEEIQEILPKIEEKIQKEEKYYDIINNISKDMSTLILDDFAYKKFNSIISDNFNFSKSALLIYNPPKQKFIYWHSKNLKEETVDKLSFDLNYNNIYKAMAKEKSYLIKKTDKNYNPIEQILSNQDVEETDFQLWIPFIFSSRIIGVFLGLKLENNEIPSTNLVEALEIIGRLNGPLLYNLFQQETIKQQQQKIMSLKKPQDKPTENQTKDSEKIVKEIKEEKPILEEKKPVKIVEEEENIIEELEEKIPEQIKKDDLNKEIDEMLTKDFSKKEITETEEENIFSEIIDDLFDKETETETVMKDEIDYSNIIEEQLEEDTLEYEESLLTEKEEENIIVDLNNLEETNIPEKIETENYFQESENYEIKEEPQINIKQEDFIFEEKKDDIIYEEIIKTEDIQIDENLISENIENIENNTPEEEAKEYINIEKELRGTLEEQIDNDINSDDIKEEIEYDIDLNENNIDEQDIQLEEGFSFEDDLTENVISKDELNIDDVFQNEEITTTNETDTIEINEESHLTLESELKEIDISEIFPQNLHKLIYFTKHSIEERPESPLSLIHIEFTNAAEIEKQIVNFKLDSFFGDVQFVVMNVVGTNGFVQIFDDMSIYVILPEIQKDIAKEISDQVITEIKNMFSEIVGEIEIEFKDKVCSYPEDSTDFVELFYAIIDL